MVSRFPGRVAVVVAGAALAAPAPTAQGKVDYRSLGDVGVRVTGATVDGRTLTANVALSAPAEVRLAVVRGSTRIVAFRVTERLPGTYRLRGRLTQVPSGKNLRLRITVRSSGVSARGFVKLAVVNHAPDVLALSGTRVAENLPAGTEVGRVLGHDVDRDLLGFGLVGGTGSEDNADFAIRAGTLVTTRALDFEATPSRTIRVGVSDGRGGRREQPFSIAVTDVNEVPTAIALSDAAVAENRVAGTAVGALSFTDPDTGDSPAFALVGGAGSGDNAAFAVDGATLRTAVSFDAEAEASYQVRVGVSDGHGGRFEQSFTVMVTNVDEPPMLGVAGGTLAYTEGDPATALDPALTVTDVDSQQVVGATVHVSGGRAEDVLAAPALPAGVTAAYVSATGTLTVTGAATGAQYQALLRAVTYRNTSDAPDTTPRTVTFTASDATGTGAGSIRDVGVTAVDDDPTTQDDTVTVLEDAAATSIPVLANDTDLDGDAISIVSATTSPRGTVSITGGGTGLTYTPDADFCNDGATTDDFTYTVDGASPARTANVRITVTCVDDGPIAADDAATVTEDDAATAVPVLADDTDLEGDPISVAAVTQPAGGTVVITGGGTGLTYRPDANFCTRTGATDDFTYTVNGTSASRTATVAMTVTCVNDAPTAIDDTLTVDQDSAATMVDYLGNDFDVDGDPFSLWTLTQPAHGRVLASVTGDGVTVLTYQPDAGYCNDGAPTDDVTYSIRDGSLTDPATVRVTVTCTGP